MMDCIGKDEYTWKQALSDLTVHYREENDYLSNLLMHTAGHDSFIRYMSMIHRNELLAYIKNGLNGNLWTGKWSCVSRPTALLPRV